MSFNRMTKIAMIVAAAGALTLPASAAHADSALPDPQQPAGTVLDRVEVATGWQIYNCADGAVTGFSRPYAGLSGEIVHWGPGPFWETYGDQGFSRIRGAVVASFPNEPGNIPDLLLNVVSTEGDGPLAGDTQIIRRDATGGVAVVGEACDGSAKWIDYTATYEFYRPAST